MTITERGSLDRFCESKRKVLVKSFENKGERELCIWFVPTLLSRECEANLLNIVEILNNNNQKNKTCVLAFYCEISLIDIGIRIMELNEFQYNSIRRKVMPFQLHQHHNTSSRKPKTFSTSNLSCISCTSSTNNSVGRKTLCLTVPEDFGAEIGIDGKVLDISRDGPAHASGVLQVGDYVRVMDNEQEIGSDDDYPDENRTISLHVIYAVLKIEQRPDCPFVIELGNRSHTSLGLALSDTSGKQIRISSIQPGSLADRCGYIKPGDILTAINFKLNQPFPCSPCYNSFQIANVLRNIALNNDSVSFTILPRHKHRISLDSEESNKKSRLKSLLPMEPIDMNSTTFGGDIHSSVSNSNETQTVLHFSIWKDGLYEDYGFSLIDSYDADSEGGEEAKNHKGTLVHQIRSGGPAFLSGLHVNDRILQINERDVSTLESTMLVPILASFDDGLNLTVRRINSVNSLEPS